MLDHTQILHKGALFMVVKTEKPLKTFTVKHRGNTVVLETDRMKDSTLEAILVTVFHHLQKNKPGRLGTVMKIFNAYYSRTIREEAVKQAKKEGRSIMLAEEEPEDLTLSYLEELMQQPPGIL
jgi:hypothetical protein